MCDSTTNCSVPLVSFGSIGGVDLKYNDADPCHYIDPGNTSAQSSFKSTCDSWVAALAAESAAHGNSNYDTLQWIGHIGFWVNRSNSCHCAGKAMDMSKVQWNGVACQPCNGDHASSNRTVRRRYLAVDATLRFFFKWTLDGWYNAAHGDHIHASSHYASADIVLDKASVSDTVFVQAVCNNFNDAGLDIDGAWGPLTDAAFSDINDVWDFDDSRCNPFILRGAYGAWLHRAAACGFADVGAASAGIRDRCRHRSLPILDRLLGHPMAAEVHASA